MENDSVNEPLATYSPPLNFNQVWQLFQETDKKFQGWNILPVLRSCEVDVENLFLEFENLQIVKQVAGTGIYWPALFTFSKDCF
ncbi:MAG: hypothetical protein EOM83_00405 [Clostridia bacterium]|nr:hypothetical protein [Clostridia bacterium]